VSLSADKGLRGNVYPDVGCVKRGLGTLAQALEPKGRIGREEELNSSLSMVPEGDMVHPWEPHSERRQPCPQGALV
jgi:hypothetical protein